MDDNLQRVFSVLLSVLILFILPLYITFEKMDDISYSLALKITSNFVDNVNSKGYITEEMYNDFVSRLSVTNMTYDVRMEHVSKKYNPAWYAYDENKNLLGTFDYSIYSSYMKNGPKDGNISISGKTYNKKYIKCSYNTSEIKYTEKQILDEVEKNGIYTMNKGDEFSVRIKNENVTIATVLFNAYTLGIGGTENNTRVYINYGGTIAEEEYMNLNDDSNSDMSYELGDINLDHTVDSIDKTFLDRYISGKEELNTVQLKLADMNGDGVVNVFDVNLLQKKLNK